MFFRTVEVQCVLFDDGARKRKFNDQDISRPILLLLLLLFQNSIFPSPSIQKL